MTTPQTQPKLTGAGRTGRGQGRKSLSGAGTTTTFNFRAPPDVIAFIKANGGSDWLRKLVKKNM